MSVPKLSGILSTIEDVGTRITQAVPIIRSTVASVTTIASGKHPTPDPAQQPATTASLTPQQGAQAIGGFLWIGLLATAAILVFGIRRR